MTAPQVDLLGRTPQPPIGMLVKLERHIDQDRACHDNLAIVCVGHGPHAAELRCAACNKHRGWLPRQALDFITNTASRFGAPSEPIILRDSTIGDHIMEKKRYDNSGILFRCSDDKQKPNDRDFRGEIVIAGREYWLSGWIKEGKKGKFLSLPVKPKDAPPADKSKSLADEMSDSMPF